ncbi:hypothetical protein FOCC_FOCC012692 [Frankliniella occidentalis]|nr:hypothetical protein FOCC_FOCC012692 [Frankliniella occidentalis]
MSVFMRLCTSLGEVADLRLAQLGVHDQLVRDIICPNLREVLLPPPYAMASLLESMGYVPPTEIDILDLAGQDPLPTDVRRPKMHFVSPIRTIQVYCSHVDVMDRILNEPPPPADCYTSDFRTGSEFKRHPLFQRHPRALRIRLFADDLEYTDALKGNTGKHQTLGVTFQIENIGAEHLSNDDSVHLALLVRVPWVKRFGRDVVLRPLMRELRELAEVGVDIQVKDGRQVHLFGAVAVFVGDNKAQHEFAGMSVGFSSGEVCRFCTAQFGNLRNIYSDDDGEVLKATSSAR